MQDDNNKGGGEERVAAMGNSYKCEQSSAVPDSIL
jgi:hypothetical protein